MPVTKEKIVYIPGIFCPASVNSRISRQLKKAFARYYPEAEFEAETCFYTPWQKQKMLQFAENILSKHGAEDTKIILLGYSMGGVIATAIAPRFQKAEVRVTTIMSPHTFLWGLFSNILGSDLIAHDRTSIVTIGGYLDLIVFHGSRHPQAKRHTRMLCDHFFGLIFSSKPAQKIAEETFTS